MADDSKAEFRRLKQEVRALVTQLRELQAKTYALTEELQGLVCDGPSIRDHVTALSRVYSELWAHRYGSPYQFSLVQDVPQWKRLVRLLGQDEVERRIVRYIKNPDVFYVKARHAFGLFVKTINTHVAPASDAFDLTDEAPPGCKHVPRCTSDVDHTRRTQAELRA